MQFLKCRYWHLPFCFQASCFIAYVLPTLPSSACSFLLHLWSLCTRRTYCSLCTEVFLLFLRLLMSKPKTGAGFLTSWWTSCWVSSSEASPMLLAIQIKPNTGIYVAWCLTHHLHHLMVRYQWGRNGEENLNLKLVDTLPRWGTCYCYHFYLPCFINLLAYNHIFLCLIQKGVCHIN